MFADKGLSRSCPDTKHIWIYLYLKLFKETMMLNKIKVTININLVAFTLSQSQFILCLELTEFKTFNLGLTTTKYYYIDIPYPDTCQMNTIPIYLPTNFNTSHKGQTEDLDNKTSYFVFPAHSTA